MDFLNKKRYLETAISLLDYYHPYLLQATVTIVDEQKRIFTKYLNNYI